MKDKKDNFLNSWYAAELTLVGIGFSACFGNIDTKNGEIFSVLNISILLSMFLVFSVIILYLIHANLMSQETDMYLNEFFIISHMISFFSLILPMIDFRNLGFILYLLFIFLFVFIMKQLFEPKQDAPYPSLVNDNFEHLSRVTMIFLVFSSGLKIYAEMYE